MGERESYVFITELRITAINWLQETFTASMQLAHNSVSLRTFELRTKGIKVVQLLKMNRNQEHLSFITSLSFIGGFSWYTDTSDEIVETFITTDAMK